MVELIAQEVKRFWPCEHSINVVLNLREEGHILMGEHQPTAASGNSLLISTLPSGGVRVNSLVSLKFICSVLMQRLQSLPISNNKFQNYFKNRLYCFWTFITINISAVIY